MARFSVAAAGSAVLAMLLGCALPRQMLATPGDLEDYRTFRTAAHEGRRLAAAQRYLARHPDGAWAGEVRSVFETEEAAWFEAAKSSRARAREYVVDLPDGPHADAARALLVLFDEHQGDVETLTLLADARRTAATLDYETARRRHVSEVLLQKVAGLLDPATWGARLESPPPALAAALRGEASSTWGLATGPRRDDQLYFVLPTPAGSQARALGVSLQLVLEQGRVVQGQLLGENLFVLWSEALLVRALDATRASDRALAASTVTDLLSGAFEATLPASRCAGPANGGELLVRACDGWAVSVRMGAEEGEVDVIDVVGPAPERGGQPAPKLPARALHPGMR
jgi:hypothetical protein